MCKQLTMLWLLITYVPIPRQHQISSAEEVWGSVSASRVLRSLSSNRGDIKSSTEIGGKSRRTCQELLWGCRLPVFAECVVIHTLGLHVWMKVLLFFYCSQNEEMISNIRYARESCKWNPSSRHALLQDTLLKASQIDIFFGCSLLMSM